MNKYENNTLLLTSLCDNWLESLTDISSVCTCNGELSIGVWDADNGRWPLFFLSNFLCGVIPNELSSLVNCFECSTWRLYFLRDADDEVSVGIKRALGDWWLLSSNVELVSVVDERWSVWFDIRADFRLN